MNSPFHLTVVIYPSTAIAPRRMSKKEFAKRLGVSERTLRNYLNNLYYPQLEKMGYSKNQRMLSASLVASLDKFLGTIPGAE